MGPSAPPSETDPFHGERDPPRSPWNAGPPLAPESSSDLIHCSLRAINRPGAGGSHEDAAARLEELVALLAEWSARINLTGHRSPTEIVEGILGRALGLSTLLPPAGTIVDLGSGAGFPGLPLAILWPGRSVTLVEARSRRHHFQRHAVRSLGLTNVETLLGRVEDLEARRHDVVVAQAVGPPEKVVELALPWARAGGRIHVPGLAAPPESPRGISAARTLAYRLPLSEREIPVWVGIRAGD